MVQQHFKIGSVRGQFGHIPFETEYVPWLLQVGFDGWEEATWEFYPELLACAEDDEAAMALAKKRKGLADNHQLKILTVAVHLSGQAVGDNPNTKTLSLVGGEKITAAYEQWYQTSQDPHKDPSHVCYDPAYVPPEIAEMIHERALKITLGAVRYAAALASLYGHPMTLPGFTGFPCNGWDDWYGFPGPVTNVGKIQLLTRFAAAVETMVKRFRPIAELAKEKGNVRFGLEPHPTELASGDCETAQIYIDAWKDAGFIEQMGFNIDVSHPAWQGVDIGALFDVVGPYVYGAHIKGAWISDQPTKLGLIRGSATIGAPGVGWMFTSAGTARDCVNQGDVLAHLKQIGYTGPVCIEWEDVKAAAKPAGEAALAAIRAENFPPADARFDDSLKEA